MKRNIEDVLREARLAGPSRQLSDRVARSFDGAEVRTTRWFAAPIPLWACAAAALVCAAFGYVVHGRPGTPPAVVYVLPTDGELGRVLSGETVRQPEDLYRGLKVSLTTRSGKKL